MFRDRKTDATLRTRPRAPARRTADTARALEKAEHDRVEDVVRERLSHESPEGLPPQHEPNRTETGLLLVGAVVLIIAAAVVTGLFAGLGAGVAVLMVGLFLGMVFNPVVWAAGLRAGEHDKLAREEQDRARIDPARRP